MRLPKNGRLQVDPPDELRLHRACRSRRGNEYLAAEPPRVAGRSLRVGSLQGDGAWHEVSGKVTAGAGTQSAYVSLSDQLHARTLQRRRAPPRRADEPAPPDGWGPLVGSPSPRIAPGIAVNWRTLTEQGLLNLNVWRSGEPSGRFAEINCR